MATTGAPSAQATVVAPSHKVQPSEVANDINDGGDSTESVFVQVLGTLGLLEVWILIVFDYGQGSGFATFEGFILKSFAAFEACARFTGMFSVCLLCSNSSEVAHSDNIKTMTRDQLHNVVYPRSPRGSRQRRDFGALAWYGLLIATVGPVLTLLTFYPLWGPQFDEEMWIKAVPSVIAVLAIIQAIAGALYIDFNQSSFALTVMYANVKAISLFVLLCGGNRLLLGEEGEGGSGGGLKFLGIPLACLQVVKIASASVGAASYLGGRRDEHLPQFTGLWRALCLCASHA